MDELPDRITRVPLMETEDKEFVAAPKHGIAIVMFENPDVPGMLSMRSSLCEDAHETTQDLFHGLMGLIEYNMETIIMSGKYVRQQAMEGEIQESLFPEYEKEKTTH